MFSIDIQGMKKDCNDLYASATYMLNIAVPCLAEAGRTIKEEMEVEKISVEKEEVEKIAENREVLVEEEPLFEDGYTKKEQSLVSGTSRKKKKTQNRSSFKTSSSKNRMKKNIFKKIFKNQSSATSYFPSEETRNDCNNIENYYQNKKGEKLNDNSEATSIIVQSYARMFLSRRQYERMTSSALVIQRNTRMNEAARKYNKVLKSVRSLQKLYRNYHLKEDHNIKTMGAVTIQRNLRMYRAAREY